ncbi:hypothetical protein ACEWA7_20055 [Vibrio parahaemolyticus]
MSNVVNLRDVSESIKRILPSVVDELNPAFLEVEERDGVVVDYIIKKAGEGYTLVIDDRDLTPELVTLQFNSGDEMIAYFEAGKRKPMILDSVEN